MREVLRVATALLLAAMATLTSGQISSPNYASVLASDCLDWTGRPVTNGNPFLPYKDDPCTICTCVRGRPADCAILDCQPPPCRHFQRVPGQCCEVVCLNQHEGRPNQTSAFSGLDPDPAAGAGTPSLPAASNLYDHYDNSQRVGVGGEGLGGGQGAGQRAGREDRGPGHQGSESGIPLQSPWTGGPPQSPHGNQPSYPETPGQPSYGNQPREPSYQQPNYGNQPQEPSYQQPNYGNQPQEPSYQQPNYGSQPQEPSYQQPDYGNQPQEPSYQQPIYGNQPQEPSYQQPNYGHQPQQPSYQQPNYGKQPQEPSYQQPNYGNQPQETSYQQPNYGNQPREPSYQQPNYGNQPQEPSYQQPNYGNQPQEPSYQQPNYGNQPQKPSYQQPNYRNQPQEPSYQQPNYGNQPQEPSYGQEDATRPWAPEHAPTQPRSEESPADPAPPPAPRGAGFEEYIEPCCELGSQWFSENREQCPTYRVTVAGVPHEQQMNCQALAQICCLSRRRQQQCTLGRDTARRQRSCVAVRSLPGNEDARECCSCCKLGEVAKSVGLACHLMDRYSKQCSATFRECCGAEAEVTTRPTRAAPTPPTPPTSTARPTEAIPDELNLCKQFPRGLCAQVCVPTPGSFRCECNDGFTLNSDGRTCVQKETTNRCAENNPCDHECVDNGFNIHCKCFDGFILEQDARTCQDINECEVDVTTCPRGQRCVNTEGSFACEGNRDVRDFERCDSGYAFSTITGSCDDIDECIINPIACRHDEYCVNNLGSYSCTTEEPDYGPDAGIEPDTGLIPGGNEPSGGREPSGGYRPDGGYQPHGGRQTHEGQQPGGGYEPSDGRQPIGGGDTEGDIREVTDLGGSVDPRPTRRPNEGEDSRTDGGQFQCGTGFVYNGYRRRCEDADECEDGSHDCRDPNQVCRNTPGSFSCQCDTGFQYNARTQQCQDVNECASSRDSCVQGQTCENTIGSYVCRRTASCGTGYTVDVASQKCLDDNECELGTHNCGLTRECQNTIGSFRCVIKSCPLGYKLDTRTGHCEPVNCPRGLKPDREGNCHDINECLERTGVCLPTQRCHNTIGSYTCQNLINCGPGFELNQAGNRCEDIDECERATHDCSGRLMECVNRPGTYLCQCPDGYQMNHSHRRCDDINECERYGGQVCSLNAICENTQGSFRCQCKDGFESQQDGRVCRDVDECLNQGRCMHGCRNTWGSFQCTCFDGFQLAADGRTCEDIDECALWMQRGSQLCVGICENTEGSYQCKCPDGYRMLSDTRTCQDIDECALGKADCRGPDDICINTRGAYKCETVTCPKGFVKASGGSRNNAGLRVPGSRPSYSRRRRLRRRRAADWQGQPTSTGRQEDDSVICQRLQCVDNDISCLLNRTKSVQWQHVALPSVTEVRAPMVLLNVQTIGYSVYPNLAFRILAGNERRLFDVIKRPGNGDRGSLRLLRPIRGPATHHIVLQMDNRNRFNNIISSHVAYVTIYISPYEF